MTGTKFQNVPHTPSWHGAWEQGPVWLLFRIYSVAKCRESYVAAYTLPQWAVLWVSLRSACRQIWSRRHHWGTRGVGRHGQRHHDAGRQSAGVVTCRRWTPHYSPAPSCTWLQDLKRNMACCNIKNIKPFSPQGVYTCFILKLDNNYIRK